MIIWVASYPRSGNLLLRTVIYQTMHIGSYNEHQFGQSTVIARSSKRAQIAGLIRSKGDWETFYDQATNAKDIFIVKTHYLPRDGQPAIYVVRDGRKALLSYSRFHKIYTPPPCPTLLELILGLDSYGDWTRHYQAWAYREKTLIVRYEDLLQPTEELLAQLAAITNYAGRIRPWKNPFEELQRDDPVFFRSGNPTWSDTEEWPSLFDAIFFHLHGKLMSKLGYISEAKFAEIQQMMMQEIMDLIDITQRLLIENKRISKICDERSNVIEVLKKTCDERLSLIEDLNKKLLCGQ